VSFLPTPILDRLDRRDRRLDPEEGKAGMVRYAGRRGVESCGVVFAAIILVFLSIHLVPGDPVQVIFGELSASPAQIRELRTQLGLDDSLPRQYIRYMQRLLHGDLGTSIRYQAPVLELIQQEMWFTIQLSLAGLAIAVVCGVGLGVLAASYKGSAWDTLAMTAALLELSVPAFWLGLLLIFLFAYRFQVFRVADVSGIRAIVLPALTLGLWGVGSIARVTRTCMLEVLGQDYLRTARAKGLRESIVIRRHALRNALIPVVTVFGIQFGHMLSGAVIVESVFARPGLGRLLVASIAAKDFPVVQGAVLVIVLVFILINFLVDLSYGWFDPRARFA